MRYIKTYKVYEAEFGEIIDNVITECIDLRKKINNDILLIFNDIYILINEKTSIEDAYKMFYEKRYRKG